MSAYLDKQRSYGERNGGVSDPRLIRKVDQLHPEPTTPEEIASVEMLIAHYSQGDPRHEAELRAMILPDSHDGKCALETKEAA